MGCGAPRHGLCLSAEPTKAKEKPGKLVHFVEVGWTRASEETKE